MKAVLSACLLFGLFSPVALLQCYFCPGGLCDTPEIVNCTDDQDACVSAVSNVKIAESFPGSLIHFKRCGKSEHCLDKRFSMHTGEGGSFRSRRECCSSDGCNGPLLTLSEPVEDLPNGILCPSCFSFDFTDSDECSGVENMVCTGEETRCVEGTMELKTKHLDDAMYIYFQGCGTPSMCTIKFSVAPISSNETKYTMKRLRCKNGTEVVTV
ncbi:phospholipase A2 inhibitor gamma subunit A1-like [Eublepharis macularius]|uniref:Phospholipase A2 inhibitor gamma subunit A1-like n=1 Tax=Eublepharis macularius TaxID=481883 RepID=A0AA97KG16_EUBMA|nr:phospholipase A2 inhibitor gamma subunit A1-like [Eublepharis macularius]